MYADIQFPTANDTDVSPQVGGYEISFPTSRPTGGDSAPGANGKPTRCITLRRQSQLMVVFQGCPHPSVVLSLRQAQVKIGLALSPRELTKIPRLDCYSYVFVSSHSQADVALAQAANDLLGASWSIDETTAWSSAANYSQVAAYPSSPATTPATDHLFQRYRPTAPDAGVACNLV